MVLSGLGRDGVVGAKKICDLGGKVLVQDPKTAVANAIPKAVINSGIKQLVGHLGKMAHTLLKNTLNLSQQMNRNKVKI